MKAITMLGLGVALWLCSTAPAGSQSGSRSALSTGFYMRDVVMFPLPNAPSRVLRLNGTAVPTRRGRMIDMDDVTSYAVRVRRAEMVMPAGTMAALMNQYILPSADTAIKRVEVAFGNGHIQMRGVMRKAGVPIGFTAIAVPSVSPRGEMLITVTKMKAAGFIPKGVMDALGLKMDKVAQPDNREVFRIQGDTMIIPVASMFPPPKFLGQLRSVRVTPSGLYASLGSGRMRVAPGVRARSYIHMRGGRVNFGRLTMGQTDLTMVRKGQGRTLGFSPRHYWQQLRAGYTVAESDYGLVAHVADYRQLGRR